MLTLSLVMITRDESEALAGAIHSVNGFCDEVVILDTGSTDDTLEQAFRLANRVYQLRIDPFSMDFGQAKSVISAMARGAYILNLDADERLTGGEHLIDIIGWMEYANIQAVSFPRRRWADLEQTKQIELEAYPDLQARLYRNTPDWIRWSRSLHEELTVKATPIDTSRFPVYLEHHVDTYHLADPARAHRRLAQRIHLAGQAGVDAEGSAEALRLAQGIDTGRLGE